METGGCPHTAIRDDISMNLAAVAELEKRHADVQLIFIESGGDNLSATFSPELVEAFIYVIDVAEGDKIPRKGGPASSQRSLLINNDLRRTRTDLSVWHVMPDHAGEKPFSFADLLRQSKTSFSRGFDRRALRVTRPSSETTSDDVVYARIVVGASDRRLRGRAAVHSFSCGTHLPSGRAIHETTRNRERSWLTHHPSAGLLRRIVFEPRSWKRPRCS